MQESWEWLRDEFQRPRKRFDRAPAGRQQVRRRRHHHRLLALPPFASSLAPPSPPASSPRPKHTSPRSCPTSPACAPTSSCAHSWSAGATTRWVLDRLAVLANAWPMSGHWDQGSSAPAPRLSNPTGSRDVSTSPATHLPPFPGPLSSVSRSSWSTLAPPGATTATSSSPTSSP